MNLLVYITKKEHITNMILMNSISSRFWRYLYYEVADKYTYKFLYNKNAFFSQKPAYKSINRLDIQFHINKYKYNIKALKKIST